MAYVTRLDTGTSPTKAAASPVTSAQTVASFVATVVPRMTKLPCAGLTEKSGPRIFAAESTCRAMPLVKSALTSL